MRDNNGYLVISLDFELFWGMADFEPLENADRFLQVHDIVPKMLDLFSKYEIHATWATVGALMAHDDDEFFSLLPNPLPTQTNTVLKRIGLHPDKQTDELPRTVVFAPDLVEMIANTPFQEIGSHTYSHYYCNLESSTPEDFQNEISASNRIAKKNGYTCSSLVFPRNCFSQEYVKLLSRQGFISFRGNERDSWLKVFSKKSWELYRAFEKIDNYIPLENNMSYPVGDLSISNNIVNINSSRFFKPYTERLSKFETLKKYRLAGELKKAASNREVYHVYWHPHNFLENIDKNFETLEWFLQQFSSMRDHYAMQSCSMQELAELVKMGDLR